MDIEQFEIKTSEKYKKQHNPYSFMNKILYFQIISLLLIFISLFYQTKNIFLNNKNKQIFEENPKSIRYTI
jgi:hypothetical protein